jgi:hypothetical protein
MAVVGVSIGGCKGSSRGGEERVEVELLTGVATPSPATPLMAWEQTADALSRWMWGIFVRILKYVARQWAQCWGSENRKGFPNTKATKEGAQFTKDRETKNLRKSVLVSKVVNPLYTCPRAPF